LNSNELLRAAIGLVIDYFRWTQLVPMLACWAFLLACLFAFILTSFESQSIAALEAVVAIALQVVALVPEGLIPRAPDGSIELSEDELLDFATWSWFLLSMLAMLINWIAGERLRPAFLAKLSGRIKSAGIATILVSGALISVRIAAPANFNGSLVSWLPFLIGAPVLVWIVSVYSLSVSAALSLVESILLSNQEVRA
jgi:hypothetical protein